MAQIFNVSLNFQELMSKARESHSAFSRSKQGVPYVSLTIFVNDAPDQYGRDVKVTLNSTKIKKATEPLCFVGNGITNSASVKTKVKSTGAPVDDLPF